MPYTNCRQMETGWEGGFWQEWRMLYVTPTHAFVLLPGLIAAPCQTALDEIGAPGLVAGVEIAETGTSGHATAARGSIDSNHTSPAVRSHAWCCGMPA